MTVNTASMNGHDPDVPETARHLVKHGIDFIMYQRRTKDPHRRGWQNEPCPPVERATDRDNIGIQIRRGLLDTDLDCLEAVRVAPFHFPATGMMWGRAGKPRSHLIHWLPDGERIPKGQGIYKDSTPGRGLGEVLLELRQVGQTVAPGSLHDKTGELVRWEVDGFGAPGRTVVDAHLQAARITAAEALVARYWQDGVRHDMALPVAGLLFYGGMSEPDAEAFMTHVCTAAQDMADLDNRLGCVRDTYRKGGMGQPVSGGQTLTVEDYLTAPQVRSLRKWLALKAGSRAGILGPDLLPLAGDGDGERFSAMWVGQVLYCAAEDAWYLWDGTRWALDTVEEIRERAKLVVAEFRRVLGEKSTLCGQNGIASYKDCADYSKAMGNAGAITSMLKSAGSRPELRVAPEEFDANPLLYNVLDCTLDLDITTGRVGSHLHDPADRIRSLAPAHYFPDATHPLLTQHLDRFFPEDDRRNFLGEIGGYALHGLPKRHAAELIGPHDAGKSSTLRMFVSAMGDYGASLAATNLAKNPHKGGDVGRPDLWRVKDKRLVIVTEVGPDTHFDVELFKAMTGGGDPYALRTFFDKTGGKDVVFKFSLWMSGNKPYGPPPDEVAAYDRLDVLDCTHVVAGAERNVQEERELTESQDVRDAVQAFAVAGFQRLYGQHHGEPVAPASSQVRKAKLVNELDEWSALIDELVVVTRNPNDGVVKSELNGWAKSRLQERDTYAKFGYKRQGEFESALERRGAIQAASKTRFKDRPYWQGVKWNEDFHGRVSEPDW